MSALSKVSWYAAAPVAATAISFVSLPIITLRLNPEDYGAYALGAVVASIVSTLGSVGMLSYLSGARLVSQDQRSLLAAASLWVVAKGLLASAGIYFIVIAFHYAGLEVLPIGQRELAMALLMGTLGAWWYVVGDVIVFTGRARLFALCTILHSLLFALTATFGSHYGTGDPVALYAAGLIAEFGRAAIAIGAMWTMFVGTPKFSLLQPLFPVARANNAAQYIEIGRSFLERWLLGVTLSLKVLGLYAHAQQYRSLVDTVNKAATKGLWETAVEEGRAKYPDFPKMRSAWKCLDDIIFLGGVCMALVGKELIGLLTHGKFSAAASFASAWLAIVLMQNAGKSLRMVITANGGALDLAAICLRSNLATLLALPVLFYFVSVWGLFVAVGFGAAVNWWLLKKGAEKYCALPLLDVRAFPLAMAIILITMMVEWTSPDLAVRIALLFATGTISATLIVRNPAFRRLWQALTNGRSSK